MTTILVFAAALVGLVAIGALWSWLDGGWEDPEPTRNDFDGFNDH